jgi:putative hemolysin
MDEKLCVFGKTAIMNKSIRSEYWKEKTIVFDKLKKSNFNKNKAALRKQKFDPMNKETDAVKFCRLEGGTTLQLKDPSGEYVICRFNDYSGIEVNAYLRGAKDPNNHKALSIRRMKKK